MVRPEAMDELDIGHPSPAVFVGVDWDPENGWVACFVSRYGDTYVLDEPGIRLRIRFLDSQGLDTGEEKEALAALRIAGG